MDNDFSEVESIGKSGLELKDSESIKVNYESGSYSFHVRNQETASPPATVSSSPFAVLKNSDTSVILSGYNPDEGRKFHNYIDFGQDEPVELEELEIDISGNIWILLKITFDEKIKIEVMTDISFPGQSSTAVYVRIAYVTFMDGKIESITQYQYGAINVFTPRFI